MTAIQFYNILQNYCNIYCNISTTLSQYIAEIFSCNMRFIAIYGNTLQYNILLPMYDLHRLKIDFWVSNSCKEIIQSLQIH